MERVKLKKIFTWESTKQDSYLWIILVLLTLPQLNPKYLGQFALSNAIVNCLRVISSLIILVWMLAVKRKLSVIVLVIGLQQGYLLLRTVIAGGAVRNCMLSVVAILSVVMLYDVALEKRKVFLSSQLFCFEVVIYINLVTEILFPDSMYVPPLENTLHVSSRYWFLGFYNSHIQYFLPALMIAFLYKEETGKSIRKILLTAAIAVSVIKVWSAGSLVTLFGMAVVYAVFKNKTKIFHYYSYWILPIIFFVFGILLKAQVLLESLIEGVLGKWHSFELRMSLWDKCLDFILARPVFGYGDEYPIELEMKTGMAWASYTHNQLLEIVYKGGIINLVLFAVIVIIAGKNVYQYRDTIESKIIATVFLGWCLNGLVEASLNPLVIGMFVIAYYSNIENGAAVPDGTIDYWKDVYKKLKGRVKINRI